VEADPASSPRMHRLRAPGLGDRGHCLPSDPKAAAVVVQGDVPGGLPALWDLGEEPQKAVGPGELPDGVDVAAQASARDGPAGRERLAGQVEVDETLIGGPEDRMAGRKTLRKAGVMAAVEIVGQGSGRLRLGLIEDFTSGTLTDFVKANVDEGTVVKTDGWSGYCELPDHGSFLEFTVPSRSSDAGSWAPTRAGSSPGIASPTSTSSPSGSTVGPHAPSPFPSSASAPSRSSPSPHLPPACRRIGPRSWCPLSQMDSQSKKTIQELDAKVFHTSIRV